MTHRFGILAVALLCSAATVGRAADYRNDATYSTLTIPTGWVEIPKAEIERMNAELARRGSFGTSVRYETGFRPASGRPGTYPYVLIQVLGGVGGADYDEIEKTLSRDLGVELKKAEGAVSDLAKQVELGSAVLDRTTNRVHIRIQMDVNGVGRIQGYSVGHLGADKMLMVHSYASVRDFAFYSPDFQKLNESVTFDAGRTFTPGPSGSAVKSKFWDSLSKDDKQMVLAGAGAAALILIGLMFRK